MGSQLRTLFFLSILTALFILIGGAVGGRAGMMFAFLFACVMNIAAYWFSDKIVLAMYRAREVTEREAPRLHRIVWELAQRAGLPMPRLYIVPSKTPNAFATGRDPNHAAVAVTEGILDLLTEEELKGVLGHELAHIKHRDILIQTVAATIAGAIVMLARMGQWALIFGGLRGDDEERGGTLQMIGAILILIIAPIAAFLIQMAISRAREYYADEGGAKFSGNPLYLANALRKLAYGVKRDPMDEANPATAHMFIVNPLKGSNIASLFSTHPPIEERISRLEAMAGI
ncbi:MAG: zinc metalloprotease HtpX [Deltaproteobacteria bacterium]|nr:zinc metalloprotease HtpX [Deltaproteobacteria bacterium]MDL1972163.1 zinc metalloprotease HtpX [Deltaproteobacteria bacterium]